MKKSGIVAALFGLLCIAASSGAFAQKLYWTTSGMFGPFDIRGLIPALPVEKSRQITIPVSMWVLDHPKGLVVFDTGNNVAISDGADNCKAYWAPGNCDFLKPSQKRADVIDMQLKKLGYSADKVKVVVTSHTHLDHVGNIAMFPNAIHVFQKKELYQGWWPEKFQGRTTPGTFVMADLMSAREFNYLELDGDYDLFGAVGNRHVVAGVEHDKALRVVENPHADGDGDLAGFVDGQCGNQASDVEGAEHTAGGPIQFLRERAGRRCNTQQAQQCCDDA